MGSYFIDNPGNAVGTNTGNGANDSLSYLNGAYWETDYLGPDANIFVSGYASGIAGIGENTPGGAAPAAPPGFVNSDVQNHPGFVWINTTTTSQTPFIVTMLNYGGNAPYFISVLPGTTSPTFVFNQVFCFPKTLSSSADRYIFYAGPAQVNSPPVPYDGWCISYSDNVNSGNFVVSEFAHSGTAGTTVNTTYTPVAGTWYRLQTTVIATSANVIMTINALGSSPTVLWSGTSPRLSVPGAMNASVAMIGISRTAVTAGTNMGALLDYSSVVISKPGRQW